MSPLDADQQKDAGFGGLIGPQTTTPSRCGARPKLPPVPCWSWTRPWRALAMRCATDFTDGLEVSCHRKMRDPSWERSQCLANVWPKKNGEVLSTKVFGHSDWPCRASNLNQCFLGTSGSPHQSVAQVESFTKDFEDVFKARNPQTAWGRGTNSRCWKKDRQREDFGPFSGEVMTSLG